MQFFSLQILTFRLYRDKINDKLIIVLRRNLMINGLSSDDESESYSIFTNDKEIKKYVLEYSFKQSIRRKYKNQTFIEGFDEELYNNYPDFPNDKMESLLKTLQVHTYFNRWIETKVAIKVAFYLNNPLGKMNEIYGLTSSIININPETIKSSVRDCKNEIIELSPEESLTSIFNLNKKNVYDGLSPKYMLRCINRCLKDPGFRVDEIGMDKNKL